MITAEGLGLDPRHQVFEGRYNAIMPELLRLGFEPQSPADVMDVQNAAVGTPFEEVVWETGFDTDFGIAGTSEKVYALPHSPRLRTITSQTKLVDYGLPLLENDLPVGVKTYDRRELILNQDLTEEQARTHPLWFLFADGNQGRLDRKVENTFRLGRERHQYTKMMGIYGISSGEIPIERSVFVLRLDVRSRAGGYN